MSNKSHLKEFTKSVLKVIDVLAYLKIVHSDLKPDNILVKFNYELNTFDNIKIIDFGSAYQFYDNISLSMATPEYMPPETLKLLSTKNNCSTSDLNEVSAPWSYDMWSLGVILLEIIVGFPLWLSLKSRVTTANGRNIFTKGLFAVHGRDKMKIFNKQATVLKNLGK